MATPEEIAAARMRLGAPMAPPMAYAQQMAQGIAPGPLPGQGALDATLQGLAASQGGALSMPVQTFVSPPPAAPLGPQAPPPGVPIELGPRMSFDGPVRGPTPEAIQAARARLGGSAAGQAYPEALDALKAARAEAVDVVKTPEPLRDARGELTKAYGEAMDAIVPEEEKAKREVDNAYGTARNAVRALQKPSVGERIRDDNAAIAGTFDAESEAVRKAADAETAKALAASSRMEEMAALQAKKAREEEKIAALADAERTRYREQTDRLASELREKKIDPSRLYGNQSTAERISFAIMGAIGGLHQAAFKSQSNPFLDQLNRNIDRDIAAQVHDLDTQKGVLSERSNIYAQMRAAHGDSALARGQVKAAMLDAAKMQLESEGARIGTPIAQARAEQQIAGIDRQAAELRRNNDVAEAQAAQRAAMANAAARAAAEEKAFQRGTTLEKLRLEDKKIELEHGEGANKPNSPASRFVATGTAPDGSVEGYLARNAEVAQKRTNALASAKKAIDRMDSILELRAEQGKVGRATGREQALALINPMIPSGALGTPAWKTKAEALHGDLKVQAKNVHELGAITAQDEPLIRSIVGEGAKNLDLFSDETGNRLRQARELFQRAVDAEGSQEAGTRVRKRVGPDGRETFERHGTNAPTNRRSAPRVDANGDPVK